MSILAVIGSHWISSGHTIRAIFKANHQQGQTHFPRFGRWKARGQESQTKKIDTRGGGAGMHVARAGSLEGGGDYLAPSVFHGD